MPPQPKPQDPALLDGASSRFADAFTRRTQLRRDGGPRPRSWTWIAAAAALTTVAVLVVFAIAKLPAGSGDKEKTVASASLSPTSSGSSAVAAPRSGSSAPGHEGVVNAARPGAGAPNGGSGTKVTGESGESGNTPIASPAAGTNTGSTPGSTSVSGSASVSGSGGSTNERSNSGTQNVQTVTYPGVLVFNHASGRCIAATGAQNSKAVDGTRLEIRDCGGGSWQKIDFRSDGTARMFGLCIDVAGASQNDGTPIQLARCNGGWAQKFILNKSHDLVNSAIGKCVDVVDKRTANGTKLQLWTCYGTDNQKWSKR
ncbi:ricin-type beta-trefoil lectin domain protein (plasmid) [Streptomyces sp. HUAS TT11]|uniref:ricin-type beta-trefoil lectin domain protein n=1 Tax=Streptomyces sp. HUAS TT11 TaxID=3447508 RepID=UPI003F6597C3